MVLRVGNVVYLRPQEVSEMIFRVCEEVRPSFVLNGVLCTGPWEPVFSTP